MASHKRVDSGVVQGPTQINSMKDVEWEAPIRTVHSFLEATRKLTSLDSHDVLKALLDKGQRLELQLQEKTALLQGCEHFNAELNNKLAALQAYVEANKIRVLQLETENETLTAACMQKQETEKALVVANSALQEEKDHTRGLRSDLASREKSLNAKTEAVRTLQESEQALKKRLNKAEQDISAARKLMTKLAEEDPSEM